MLNLFLVVSGLAFSQRQAMSSHTISSAQVSPGNELHHGKKNEKHMDIYI
jgi:hypothetical protein